MKTVRFLEVVKVSGRPEPYTLWTDPKKDRSFQTAVKQHRVVSVHQETVGSKADYGTVGFENDKQAQILIFPKSVQRFAEKKIIGVKYELLEKPKEPAQVKKAKPAKVKEKPLPHASERKPKHAPVREIEETARVDTLDPDELRKEIRKAMRLLEEGKVVAAYRTLEKLV